MTKSNLYSLVGKVQMKRKFPLLPQPRESAVYGGILCPPVRFPFCLSGHIIFSRTLFSSVKLALWLCLGFRLTLSEWVSLNFRLACFSCFPSSAGCFSLSGFLSLWTSGSCSDFLSTSSFSFSFDSPSFSGCTSSSGLPSLSKFPSFSGFPSFSL